MKGNSSANSNRKRPRKSSVPKRIVNKAAKLERFTEEVIDENSKTENKNFTGEHLDNPSKDELYQKNTNIEDSETDTESDILKKEKEKKKYKYKKKYIARNHGVDFPEPVITDSPDGKPIKVLFCKLCNKECKSKSSYVAHYKACSDPTTKADGKHECDVCGRRYETRRNLSRHMKMHIGDDRLRCQVCGRQFSEIKSLRVGGASVFFEFMPS